MKPGRSVPLVLLNFLQLAAFTISLSCVGPDGGHVDWYVLYKLPELGYVDNDMINDGTGYMYLTSDMISSGDSSWVMSDEPITDKHSAAGRTLTPVYEDAHRDSLIYIFYNDEKPVGDDDWSRGHTKGVMAAENGDGFWLLHNVPHLAPSPPGPYSYPHTGQKYGQSFLCLSLKGEHMLDSVGNQFLYSNPQIYASKISESLSRAYPNIARVINDERVSDAPYWASAQLETPGGDSWTSYAKSGQFADDIYAGLASPHLKTPMIVEIWRHYSEDRQLPSNCSIDYPVYNANTIKISASISSKAPSSPLKRLFTSYDSSTRTLNVNEITDDVTNPKDTLKFTFETLDDHSKWSVSTDSALPWVCVGDMNRATSQNTRGGTLVCMKNSVLWTAYNNLVAGYDPCPKRD